MDVQVSGDGDSLESEGACAKATQKRSKGKSKVWEKVAWFTRRSRSRDNPAECVALADSETASLPPDHMDLDLSPTNSTYDNSPMNSAVWLVESSSSSDGELFDGYQDSYRIKRSRLYPNSEIIEQNCLKPSIARALFLQMEATNYRQGKGQKFTWQKKKSHSDRLQSDPLHMTGDSQSNEDLLSRTVSLPHEISKKSAVCHCPACCTCTPAQRLMGACPAHARLSTSTASLDTGLSLSSHCAKPFLLAPAQENTPSTNKNSRSNSTSRPPDSEVTSVEDNATEGTTLVVPSLVVKAPFDVAVDVNQFKSNSLPLYYGKRCKVCNKPTYRSHLPNCMQPFHPDVPNLNVCECSIPVSCIKSTTHKTPTKVNQIAKESVNVNPNPTEFRKRTELIKEWYQEFNDEQKNLLLKELLASSELPQIHLLSLALEPRLHEGCPPNCQDMLTWLPHSVSLFILSYLDPVSLCLSSAVCKSWYQLANDRTLWRQLCCLAKWRLSRAGEQKQLLQTMMPNGNVDWKQVFSERYRLRNNWLRGKCYVRTFEGHTQGISCVQFDDTRIVSGSSDKTIKVWNIRTNSPWSVQTLVGHSGTVRCLHLQGNRLVSGSTDRTIKVWDLSTQQSWSSIACKVTMVGHLDTVRCLQVDDEKVISGSYDKTLKMWDIRTGQCHRTLRGHGAAVLCVQFDDQKIVSGSCDKFIKVWNNQGDCLMTLQGHQDAVTCLQFDDTRIISGSLDCNLKFWNIHTGECVNTIDWKASEGHTGVVRCLQADSWRVVSASDDRTLKVWNLETGERLVTLRNHTDGVTCLQFNDSIIVSGSYDKTVKLWDFSCC